MYVEKHTNRQVYKNAKTHNVYHRCLCFIFDETTMALEQKCLSVLILLSKYACSAIKRALMSRDMKIDDNNKFLLITSGHFPQMARALFPLKAY